MAQFELTRSNLQTLIDDNPAANGFIVSVGEETLEVTANLSTFDEENIGGSAFGCPFPPGCNPSE